MDEIVVDRPAEGVAVVTLNRPAAMNALSARLRASLAAAFGELRDDGRIRAVVLTGAGDRAFTAGLDLKELGADTSNLASANDRDPRSNPVAAIEACGKPVIGAINGVAITGGLEVAIACTLRIASTNARFADTHALVGIMPGWGLSQRLSRTIGVARAKELSLSGRFIDAETASRWGLVNHVVAPDRLLAESVALASRIAAVDAAFVRDYNALIDQGYDLPLGKALAYEHAVSSRRNSTVTADDVEGRRHAVLQRGRSQTDRQV